MSMRKALIKICKEDPGMVYYLRLLEQV